jgi:virginiamycin B lyase
MRRDWRVLSRLGLLGMSIVLGACGGGASSTSAPASAPTVAATPAASPSSAPTVAPQSTATPSSQASVALRVREFDVVAGSHPHDVAPAPDGGVWYTGQRDGTLGHLDPATGKVRTIRLGAGSAPHGVITGPDGNAWITDGGLNAIVRVDAKTDEVTAFPLPADRRGANLNTAVFDRDGTLWFTGQTGIYGRLDPATGEVAVFDDPEGRGPYGITATPSGEIWYASLAGSHIAKVDRATGKATIVEPPTPNQGARRVWSDSRGRIWVSEWDAGQVGVHDPATGTWREWKLPGNAPQAYAVYVDDRDIVWLTDFGANAIVRFDPSTERFDPAELPSAAAAVRQLLGRTGEVWGAESARDKLVLLTED